jgi:hypothetical protein
MRISMLGRVHSKCGPDLAIVRIVRELSENWVRLVRNDEGHADENARVFLTFGAVLRTELLAVC